LKKQITYGFAALLLLVGVFSASSGAVTKSKRPVNGIALPAPVCDPTENTNCRMPH